MPEPTATGPNGEKIVFRGGRWQPLTAGAPQSAPQQRAPINTGTDPRIDIARSAENRQQQEFAIRQEDAAEKRRGRDEERRAVERAVESSKSSIARTVKILKDIKADATDFGGGFGETGTSGNLMRAVPIFANAAKDLERKVQSVKGLNAFTALKDLASQGVKLTPISNVEIDLAASSVANIDPSMTQEEFLAALDQAIAFHENALNQLGTGSNTPGSRRSNPDDDALIRKYLP